MELTIGQAIEILGRVASVNEGALTFMNKCITGEMYDDIRSSFNLRGKELIAVDVKVELDYTNGIKVIRHIAEQAKDKHLTCYLDANKVLESLEELKWDIERQNKQ